MTSTAQTRPATPTESAALFEPLRARLGATRADLADSRRRGVTPEKSALLDAAERQLDSIGSELESLGFGEVACTCSWSKHVDHDRLLAVEHDFDALVHVVCLAERFIHRAEFETRSVDPEEYLQFAAWHGDRWTRPDLTSELFQTLRDVHVTNIYAQRGAA
jgi:hypothetical protein